MIIKSLIKAGADTYCNGFYDIVESNDIDDILEKIFNKLCIIPIYDRFLNHDLVRHVWAYL